jgi:4-amino-4-deoxy-L-arabinose transferase-like glycosyltransferase
MTSTVESLSAGTRTDLGAPSAERAQSRRVLYAIVFLGVVLRLAAIGALGTGGASLYEYGAIAKNLDHGRGYSLYADFPKGPVRVGSPGHGRPLPSAFMAPGYAVIVAGAEGVGHSQTKTIRILQLFNVLAGAATIVMSFLLATRLFGRRAGLWSALAVAVYPVLLYQATQSSASNAYVFLDLLTLYLLVLARRSASLLTAGAAGVAVGAVCLFRAEAVLLIPIFAAWLGWSVWRNHAGPSARRRFVMVVATFLVAAVVLPAAWTLRNSVVLGQPTASITTSAGFNLWVGNREGASGSQKKSSPPTGKLLQELNRLPATSNYESRRDSLFMSAAVHDMSHHVGATLARDAKKLGMTLTIDVYDHRARNVIYVGSWAILLLLGIGGALRRPGEFDDRILLALFILYALAVPTLFFTLARYRLGVEMPLLLFAGPALCAVEASVLGRVERSRARPPAVRAE